MEDKARQTYGKLAVVEEDSAYFVVQAEEPDDWLARFEKRGGFPAREWAENMVRVYNRRLSRRSDDLPTPPGRHPRSE